MTQSSWPFENADTTESQYSKLFNRLKTSGVAGFPANTALKVTGDSSGMNVKVGLGFAIVRGFAYELTTTVQTMTIGASSANPRIDLVCLTLDPTVNSVVLEVVAGTPAAVPVAPALTQSETGTYQLEIGRVTVPALATVIAAGDVSDTRPCLGEAVGIWTTTQRPATGRMGQLGWSTTNDVLEVYNGSAWIEAAPNNIDAATITSGTLDPAILGAVSIANLTALGSVADIGQTLAVDAGYAVIGIPSPQINYGYIAQSVGTSYTTLSTDLVMTGSSQYAITMTAHIVSAVSADATVTLRMWVAGTNYDYECFLPNGKKGVITATRYFPSAPATSSDLQHQLKVSAGSNISIQTSTTVVGIN